jgi:lipopolysaccharide export system permease protein
MIIYRAFAREAVRNSVAITLILALVMGFVGITTLLRSAVSGDVAQDIVLQMLGLQTLKRLDLLLTLGAYLGVLMTASRWYRDSEMTVLAACGIGLTQLLRPMAMFVVVVGLAIAALGFYFTPWAAERMVHVKVSREQQRQPVTIAPGVFNETSGRTRIFYAERVDRETGALGNVFISSLETGKESVVVARGGYPRTDERTGDRFLVLSDGTLYEGVPGAEGYRLVKFKSLHARIEPKVVTTVPPKNDALPTLELIQRDDRPANAEWHWRLSKPVVAAVLVLFAMVLAYTDPRRGRLANLFVAILVYFIYSNVLALGQALIKKGLVPSEVGLWWVHAVMAVLAIYLFRQRANNRPLFALPGWGRRR